MVYRGRKEKRVLQGALVEGGLAALHAAAQGKNPLLHGVLHAIAGGSAMSEHRLAARAKALASRQQIATSVAGLVETLEQLRPAPAATGLPAAPSPALLRVRQWWQEYVNAHGAHPAGMTIPGSVWSSIPDHERAQLVADARGCGVIVSVGPG